ncbi:hypothetical protein R3Q06_29370, partial [Rhodococcus erythropolis]|uniref:LtfC-like domain-containing protein n=1 Tax=Rhodococcus erythropolis TaxID=1833 RepID=UPI002948C54C
RVPLMIGWTPVYEDIALNRGDFIFSRTRSEGPIQPGTVIEIAWANGVNWPGDIDGDTVSWRVESTQVAAVPDGTAFAIWVRYPNSTTETTDDYEWIAGRARRSATH